MNGLRRLWLKLRGHSCFSCRSVDVFRSNGDGQVSRMHTFCRNAQSPHHNRPIPAETWCDHWQEGKDGGQGKQVEIEETGLTA